MDTRPILLSETGGSVARLTLNRPEAGNSLSMDLVAALRAELDRLAARKDSKVIVLSGTGGRIFCAGHDLNEFAGDPDPDFLARDFAGIAALMQAILAQPQIVIAKVDGVATAAGCELVAACDLALASSVARFAVPGVNIGFWCHTPQVQLTRTIGRKAAMMMLATGRLFPADHALRIGLINEVHPPEQLDQAVDDLAATIASKSGAILAIGKRSFQLQSAM
ncbi:MAG: enoyl-CoA hydratase-related protein, partial [Paracoccus sp.]|nr:enoyl-CoA hydratase-related protein [Paracoccus sp. (in: a-proteobacteria)]